MSVQFRYSGDLAESVALDYLFGKALELTGELEKQAATLIQRKTISASDTGALWGLALKGPLARFFPTGQPG